MENLVGLCLLSVGIVISGGISLTGMRCCEALWARSPRLSWRIPTFLLTLSLTMLACYGLLKFYQLVEGVL